jgi:hypothetical protein
MMQNYAKMEESNLEQTFQDLREQNVPAYIKFIGKSKVLLLKSKVGKVSMTHPRYNWANLTPFYLLK